MNTFKKALLLSAFSAVIGGSSTFSAKAFAAKAKTTKTKAAPQAETFKANAENTQIDWLAKKVTGQHNGKIKLKSGEFKASNNTLSGGSFIIDMTSISCSDIEDKKTNDKLIGHLKSDDFFSVTKHPNAEFKITQVAPIANAAAGAPNYTLTGDLTIKGITKPISFPATVKIASGTLDGSATLDIDRTNYDVRYGSGKFFEKLGDKTIDDKFKIDLKLSAKKS